LRLSNRVAGFSGMVGVELGKLILNVACWHKADKAFARLDVRF